jgi:hypothetical protein
MSTPALLKDLLATILYLKKELAGSDAKKVPDNGETHIL